ncbi:MAG TPA: M67 family metallopeptidase [Blastocatellia bacterium]|nr:M67 family metallopeptidase [Blastocatellia bacterium]
MAIKLKQQHLEQIRAHGEQAYPHECCGFLLGRHEHETNILVEAYTAENERQDSRETRYLITPEQYKRADGYARDRGLGIIGYYHSHPDHPAAPSGYDLDHSCWPGESYIIVAVEHGKAAALNSFTKPDYTRFEQEEIIIEGS